MAARSRAFLDPCPAYDGAVKIRFLNPVEQVTGSCYWLRDDERNTEFLVDCGMVQGEQDAEAWNRRPFEFRPADLKWVFLTHTHIDHCGLLPRLAKEGFRGSVFCTRESAALAKIALKRGAPCTAARCVPLTSATSTRGSGG